MTVRSFVIGRAVSVAAQSITLYQVPVGHTVLLKSVEIENSTGAEPLVIMWLIHNPPFVQVDFVNQFLAAGANPTFLNYWLVLEENDTVGIYSDHDGVRVWVSGSLLVGTAASAIAGTLPSLPDAPPQPIIP